jgi:hypothetical protein
LVSTLGQNDNFDTKRLFVCYSEFSHIINQETGDKIPKDQLSALIDKYKKEDVWIIQMLITGFKIFYFKERQIEIHRNDKFIEEMKNDFFELIKPYDEFDYIRREQIWIGFDSKENFDKNYGGSWYNYR